ncbi:MAG: pitrilysin family protein [Rickettsiales bacterium]
MTYRLTTLKNGMRVASEFLPSIESVAVTISVGAGARHENEDENGISHLLEHMAFKGTKNRSASEIAEAFDSIGGHLNAYTSMEMTVYFAKVLKQNTELAVDILADIIQNSTFLEEELKREKEVIIQEIAMHKDSPEDLVVDCFDSVAFAEQPLGRSILGTEENIRSFGRDKLISYMQSHYTTEKIVISAAGNIEHENFVSIVERFFDMPPSDKTKKHCAAKYIGGGNYVKSDFEQLHIIMGFPAVALDSPQYYPMQLYATILGGGMSSRLFQEVREKLGLAYNIYAGASAYAELGVMSVYSATSPEKARELSYTICEQLKNMTENISDKELIKAKNQQKAELLMARENPQTVANWIGRHLILLGKYNDAFEIIKKIEGTQKHEIINLATQIINGKMTVAALGDISHMPDYEELSGRLGD